MNKLRKYTGYAAGATLIVSGGALVRDSFELSSALQNEEGNKLNNPSHLVQEIDPMGAAEVGFVSGVGGTVFLIMGSAAIGMTRSQSREQVVSQ